MPSTAGTRLSNSAVLDRVIAGFGLQTPTGSSQGQVLRVPFCTLGNHGFICIIFRLVADSSDSSLTV